MSSDFEAKFFKVEKIGSPEDGLLVTVIRIGLYLGAIFQLICVIAVLCWPEDLVSSHTGRIWNYLMVSMHWLPIRIFAK